MQQLKNIADAYAVSVIDAVNKTNAGIMSAEEALKGVRDATLLIEQEWKAYMATTLTVEEEKLAHEAVQLYKPANESITLLENELKRKSGKLSPGSLSQFDGPLYDTIDPISSKISQLVELQLRVAKDEYNSAQVGFKNTLTITIALIVVAIIFAILVGFFISRSITRQLGGEPNYATEVAKQVTSGDLSVKVQERRHHQHAGFDKEHGR